MKISIQIVGLLLSVVAAIAPLEAGEQEQNVSVQALSTIMDQMNSLWQTYQDPSIMPARREKIAEQLIQLKKRAGILSHRDLGLAFAMRAWRLQKSGRIDDALNDMRIAVALDPNSREVRIGYANSLASKNITGFTDYIPVYFDSLFRSFNSVEGRFHFLADVCLWIGVSLLIFSFMWGAAMIKQHFLSVHHTIGELLRILFSADLSGLLATMLFTLPILFGLEIHWIFLLLFPVTWGIQRNTEKVVSLIAIIIGWIAVGLISYSSALSLGFSDSLTQAGFAAERMDGNYTVVNSLEQELIDTQVFTNDGITDNLDETQRRNLFAYALGIRKIGKESGLGYDVLTLFERLAGNDDLGLRARINSANIRYERSDLRGAMVEYQAIISGTISQPSAIYNLWQINYTLRNLDRAQELWSRLQAEHPQYIRMYSLNNDGDQPDILDAGLTKPEINQMVSSGLGRVTGIRSDSQGVFTFILDRLSTPSFYPLLLFVVVVIFSELLARFFGFATQCNSCGKIFCKHCDVDAKVTSVCQSCNAVVSLKMAGDAELRRSQKNKQERFKRNSKIRKYILNFVLPGFEQSSTGSSLLGSFLLLGWSLFAGLIYSIDRMPRIESFPFFSHWTVLTFLLLFALLLVTYGISIWLTVKKDQTRSYGASR